MTDDWRSLCSLESRSTSRKGTGAYTLLMGLPSHSYWTSPAIWDHTVLPATRHKWTRAALISVSKPVGILDLPTPEAWKAGFRLPGNAPVGSRICDLSITIVRRPNRYTTEPPSRTTYCSVVNAGSERQLPGVPSTSRWRWRGLERCVEAVLTALTAYVDDSSSYLVVVLEHDVLDRLTVGTQSRTPNLRTHPVVLKTHHRSMHVQCWVNPPEVF